MPMRTVAEVGFAGGLIKGDGWGERLVVGTAFGGAGFAVAALGIWHGDLGVETWGRETNLVEFDLFERLPGRAQRGFGVS